MNFKDHLDEGDWFAAACAFDPVQIVRLAQRAGLTDKAVMVGESNCTQMAPLRYTPEGGALIQQGDEFFWMTLRLHRPWLHYEVGDEGVHLYRVPFDPRVCRRSSCTCPPCQDDDESDCDECSCCEGTCFSDYQCYECHGEPYCTTHEELHDQPLEEVS